MEIKEFTGKNIDDAITNAQVSLGVTASELGYEVVEKGSGGLFGIGAKEATIKAWLKADEEAEKALEESKKSSDVAESNESAPADVAKKEKTESNREVDPNAAKEAEAFLNKVFEAMELDVTITTSVNDEEKALEIDLSGPQMGVIIGKRGATLDSLQYLTNLAVNRQVDKYTRVKIDTEDYRRRRKETLENLAKNMAYKAKRNRKAVSLEPMNPYERRVIHSALQNDKYVTTHSEGEEPYRHVVITCK